MALRNVEDVYVSLSTTICETLDLHNPSLSGLSISIGNIPLRLNISDDTLYQKAFERYSAFLAQASDALPIFLNRGNDLDRSPDIIAHKESRFACTWESSSLRLQDTSAYFDGVRHEFALDSLIRILLSALLSPEKGFLLHAATILRDGHAYVFTGRSGAGKSTVASLSPVGSVLTDEISLLRFVDGAWHAFGTPFWGEFRADGANIHAPIAGLYFLQQSPHDRREAICSREALLGMLPNVLFFSRERQLTESLLRSLDEFLASVQSYKLFFRKDASFWNVVRP